MAGSTTQITGPGSSGSFNPFSQISNALAPIYGMFGPASGGSSSAGGGGGSAGGGGTNVFGGTGSNATNIFGGSGGGSGPAGLQPQPVSAGNDDLTKYLRSLMGLLGTSGAGLLQGGGNLINTGMGIVNSGLGTAGSGLGVTGSGLGVTGAGLGMLNQPYSYWQKLMSGDPSTVAAAAGPYANILSQQMNAATDAGAASMPMGGARAAYVPGRAEELASQIGNFELGLQPTAAKEEANIANQIAGIGQGISGTGLGISGVGLGEAGVGQGVMGTGTTLTGQGLTAEDQAVMAALQKMQTNIQGGTTNTATQWMNAIANLLGTKV